jgi:CBS domain-containing protein
MKCRSKRYAKVQGLPRTRATETIAWRGEVEDSGPAGQLEAHSEEKAMTTAREIMTGGVECIGENETLEAAARKMKELDVGALPICGEDNRLKGMITDRDIVIKCFAEGGDPRTAKAGDFGQGKPVTIGADDSIEEAIRTMEEHQVRRLPVIDGHDLVGILSQADIARNYPEDRVGELVELISFY